MITYDYYRIFYFVAQYHSFTKAAEILKNNQPNITRCMNNLESELGCKLFIRSHQGVTLTAEGEKVYERVAVAYEQLRTVEEELALERSLESGLITIGASETALRLMLLSRLEHFHTRYPHVRLRISNHSTPQAIQALENGLVDFERLDGTRRRRPSRRTKTVWSTSQSSQARWKSANRCTRSRFSHSRKF